MLQQPPMRDITVRFALTKGEGVWPEVGSMTTAERQDLRRAGTFFLDTDHQILEAAPAILSCEFVYNGIQPVFLKGVLVSGMIIQGSDLLGHPCPIVRFRLREPVDPDQFLRGVWGSSYKLSFGQGEHVFYAEDWNGYSSILSKTEIARWRSILRKRRLLGSKTFTVRQAESGIRAVRM